MSRRFLSPPRFLILIAGAAALSVALDGASGQGQDRAWVKTAGLVNPYASVYQAILDRAVKAGLPGLAVLIKTPEEGAWIGTGGYAELESRTLMHPESVFYSSSHIKIFTAAAVLMLWQGGLIDLDAPIDRFLPAEMSAGIANSGTATVRNLLNHTSGIPDFDLPEPWDNAPLATAWRDDIESIYGKKADFRAGERFQYANVNFLLLAVIVDGLAGDHADFMSRMIFQPLGMTHTYYRREPELPRPPRLVTPYFDRYGDGALESAGDVAPLIRRNHAYGYTDLLADLSDHVRFLEALFGGELIGPETLKMMSTPQGAASLYGYGLGMTLQHSNAADDEAYGLGYGHGGRAPFGVMDVSHYPKIGATIALASNYGVTRIGTTVQNLYDELRLEFARAVFRRTAVQPGPGSSRGGRPIQIIRKGIERMP